MRFGYLIALGVAFTLAAACNYNPGTATLSRNPNTNRLESILTDAGVNSTDSSIDASVNSDSGDSLPVENAPRNLKPIAVVDCPYNRISEEDGSFCEVVLSENPVMVYDACSSLDPDGELTNLYFSSQRQDAPIGSGCWLSVPVENCRGSMPYDPRGIDPATGEEKTMFCVKVRDNQRAFSDPACIPVTIRPGHRAVYQRNPEE